MSDNVRQNEIIGELDARLLKLENGNKWDDWFGKHPGIVLGVVICTLLTGFWAYHTWEVERLEKNFNTQLLGLKNQNKERLDWMEKQNKERILSLKERCTIEKGQLSSKLDKCDNETENITKR